MTSHKEVSEWYNEKYAVTGDSTRRSIQAFYQIEDLIQHNVKSILDVGCGRGEFLEYLANKGFKNLAGVDLSETAIAHLNEILPECEAKIGAGEKLPFDDNQFDLITCLGVLEHFLDIPGGLNEMNRVCSANGQVIIMVPNKNFIGWFFKSSEEKGTQQKEISETLHSVSEWKTLIEQSGIEIKSITTDKGFIYNNADVNSKSIKFYLKRLLFLLMPLIPTKLSYQVIFHGVKKSNLHHE